MARSGGLTAVLTTVMLAWLEPLACRAQSSTAAAAEISSGPGNDCEDAGARGSGGPFDGDKVDDKAARAAAVDGCQVDGVIRRASTRAASGAIASRRCGGEPRAQNMPQPLPPSTRAVPATGAASVSSQGVDGRVALGRDGRPAAGAASV